MASSASIVICGAGIAGVAVAHELAVVHGWRDVVLVEAGDPLALTRPGDGSPYESKY